ncbi:uncharacterized protein B0T23DRAFT_312564 [Neurospora hispaniola]|uniref:Uncharacterized protein n=1 Tax=Neurospora hispaniola TaxID=588809 RepID=A0AAJ0MUS8_9PEZI|nr:hypothetical protein B0T23DRAFT_312564 [Neurospora hispaniola]
MLELFQDGEHLLICNDKKGPKGPLEPSIGSCSPPLWIHQPGRPKRPENPVLDFSPVSSFPRFPQSRFSTSQGPDLDPKGPQLDPTWPKKGKDAAPARPNSTPRTLPTTAPTSHQRIDESGCRLLSCPALGVPPPKSSRPSGFMGRFGLPLLGDVNIEEGMTTQLSQMTTRRQQRVPPSI